MRGGWLVLGSVVLVSLAVAHWGCEVPPLMAPASSISLIANPGFIVANGGVSVITAIVTEPAGTFAPDGTVVFFFTTLGRIDPQGKTVDGVARVNLVADSRSGDASVTAFSGGAAPNPSGGGGGSGGTTEPVKVTIGSALPERMVLSTDPSTIRSGSSCRITATVFDHDGNPVANVPVIFSITTNTARGALESGGTQRFTDTNGQAFDTLLTRAGVTGTVTITATTSNGTTPTLGVQVTVTS
jgi:hypothetical protein